MNRRLSQILRSIYPTIDLLLNKSHFRFHSIFQADMAGSKLASILLLVLLSLSPTLSYSQKTKAQLENEKKENLKKIAEAERILAETATQKEATLGQLQALSQQIRARQSLINSIAAEIKILDGELTDLSIVVASLQTDLKNLKDEYADQIYKSYKSNKGNNRLAFLFTAKNFNQLVQRLKYLEQYSEARTLQAEQIDKVTKELSEQRNQVEAKRSEQQRLLNQQVRESRKLANSKQQQSALVAQLSKKERQLRKEVNDRKKAIEKLNTLIASIVESEVERSKTFLMLFQRVKPNFPDFLNRIKTKWAGL